VFEDSQTVQQVSPARIVALTGFMGAGKTSVGHALAVLLRWSFVDLDREIEIRQDATIRNIFRLEGESRFREIETETLRRTLEHLSAPTVIALGGGTFVRSVNVDLLRNSGACVVFLETPMERMLDRCVEGVLSSEENMRPLAADPDAFRALYSQRLPQYRAADLTVNTANRTAEENAGEIAAKLRLGAAALGD
jgi:shikimate kinase